MTGQTVRHVFMPYCLQRIEDGRYIVLNRSYKPLGVQTSDWVDYDQHPSAAPMSITPETARRLSWKASENTDVIHLYHDGSIPTDSAENMRAYLDRLAILMAVKIQTKR